MLRKKNLAVYIDGENISPKRYEEIKKKLEQLGVCGCAKVYGRQKDERTKGWTECVKQSKGDKIELKDIRLFGPPEKDKVDKKIKKDIKKDILNNKSIDVVCLVSSDKGYKDVVEECRKKGKRVVVIN